MTQDPHDTTAARRRKRFVDNQRRVIVDVKAMRAAASKLLGWELTPEEAASFVMVSPRNWLRWENGTDKTIPTSCIRLFWYEVALTCLEQYEDAGRTEDLEKALKGKLTVNSLFNFLFEQWDPWDPEQLLHKKAEEKKL